jgi:hypothetical protein
MGTSTVKSFCSDDKILRSKCKDEKTTTKKLGFRITGYLIRGKEN